MAVRHIELAVLQITQQIDELLTATESILQGKLPIPVINPTILHIILRFVTLNLPKTMSYWQARVGKIYTFKLLNSNIVARK